MPDMVRTLQSDIFDLERIIAADEAVLELERSPEKRIVLREEISDAQNKIERLKCRIDNLSGVD
jgi:hypothetical protein